MKSWLIQAHLVNAISPARIIITAPIVAATLGVSITFTVIVSQIPSPNRPAHGVFRRWNEETARTLVAAAWLLFIIEMGWATFFSFHFLAHEEMYEKGFELDRRSNDIKWFGVFAVALLTLINVGAFICLSLVVVIYVDTVEWVAVGSVSIFGFCMMILVLIKSPIGTKFIVPWWKAPCLQTSGKPVSDAKA
jgi:hypothetical protein